MKLNSIYKIVSYVEGISYILLLGIGVPLKYLFLNESWVKALGMPHGLLFVAYIFLTIAMKQKYAWPNSKTLVFYIASVIPFGTFYTDYRYLRNLD